MPIYDYKCLSCKYQFSEIQSINDPEVDTCPKCKEKKIRKILSLTQARTTYSARENYERIIKQEAKEIAEKIKAGDEEAAADFFGEDKMFE